MKTHLKELFPRDILKSDVKVESTEGKPLFTQIGVEIKKPKVERGASDSHLTVLVCALLVTYFWLFPVFRTIKW